MRARVGPLNKPRRADVDHDAPEFYSGSMSGEPPFDTDALARLERRVEDLVALCRRLREDNAMWRARHQALSAEYVQLNERTRVARTRVEEMIGRVTALAREGR